MVISKLLQKYKVGCGRGMSAIQKPNLHFMINSIIDWKESFIETIPPKEGEEPVKPKPDDYFLNPGDCFCIGNSEKGDKTRIILAIDKDDTIVCIINDTGVLALDRIYDEKILPEFELQKKKYDRVQVNSWTAKNTNSSFPKNENHIVEVKINKFKYKIWKDRFFKNRGDIKFPEGYLELNVISDETLGQEITLLFTKYGVYYLNDSVETELFNMPDFLSDIADLTISWMYNEVPEL